MAEPIVFVAEVYKVQTLATDGGVRITLNLPETAIMQMAQLAECQRFGVAIEVTAIPVEIGKENDTESGTVSRTTAKRRKPSGDPGV